eukprot:1644181-Rhodomonas_salina.1
MNPFLHLAPGPGHVGCVPRSRSRGGEGRGIHQTRLAHVLASQNQIPETAILVQTGARLRLLVVDLGVSEPFLSDQQMVHPLHWAFTCRRIH